MNKTRKLIGATLIALFIGAAFPYINHAMDRTYEGLKILIDVMTLIRNNYVEEVEPKKLIYGAAKGMTSTLDDYSVFMEPEEYERIKSDTDGEFGGLGIRVELRDGWLTVATPMPGTPAWRAKIMPGDRIVKINGESTKGETLEDSVNTAPCKPEPITAWPNLHPASIPAQGRDYLHRQPRAYEKAPHF